MPKNDRTGKDKRKTSQLKIIKERKNDEKRHSVEDDMMEPCESHADNNMELHNKRKRRLETEEDNEGSKKVSAHRRIDVASLLIS